MFACSRYGSRSVSTETRAASRPAATLEGGRRLVGTRVIALVDGLRVRVITENGELIRELTLDPSRDYQPHGRT